jgi:hypothetical protein
MTQDLNQNGPVSPVEATPLHEGNHRVDRPEEGAGEARPAPKSSFQSERNRKKTPTVTTT